jgi:pimeloyl-ACP methyl ester carboxylesterase
MPYTANNGVRIHYEVEGEGTPLVLQHGFSSSLLSWRDNGYVDALKGDYKLIMIDSRGHGASDKPHDPEAYDMKIRVGDVLAVMDAEGVSKAHYWGYSMGGQIGFELAKRAPERFHSLILGGMHPYKRDASDFGQRIKVLKQGIEAYIASMDPQPDPERKARLLTNDGDALAAALDKTQHWPGTEDVLASMAMPCLLFAGEADAFFEGSKDAASRIPNSTFFSMPGLDHGEANQRSDLVLPHATKFLAGVSEKAVAAD